MATFDFSVGDYDFTIDATDEKGAALKALQAIRSQNVQVSDAAMRQLMTMAGEKGGKFTPITEGKVDPGVAFTEQLRQHIAGMPGQQLAEGAREITARGLRAGVEGLVNTPQGMVAQMLAGESPNYQKPTSIFEPASPNYRALTDSIIPDNMPDLVKVAGLTATSFIGAPVTLPGVLAVGATKAVGAALIDVMAKGRDNIDLGDLALQSALIMGGEGASGLASRLLKNRYGDAGLAKVERSLADRTTEEVVDKLPALRQGSPSAKYGDIKGMGSKGDDLYEWMTSREFHGSRMQKVLGQHYQQLDDSILETLPALANKPSIPVQPGTPLGRVVLMHRDALKTGVSDPNLMSFSEIQQSVKWGRSVAARESNRAGELQALAYPTRELVNEAYDSYATIVQHLAPELSAKMLDLNRQFKAAHLIFDQLSPNKGAHWNLGPGGARLKVESSSAMNNVYNELEDVGLQNIVARVSEGKVGQAWQISGINSRVSGAPFGTGLGFMGGQLPITVVKPPGRAAAAPFIPAGPTQAATLGLFGSKGQPGEAR